MIKDIPDNWQYNESLDILFFFYQRAEELLSDTTSDTYSLPQHNVLTLFQELNHTFHTLNDYDIIQKYYEKYIPPIIEEFLAALKNDEIIKKMFGSRLDNFISGIEEAKKNFSHLEAWLELFMHSIDQFEFYIKLQNRIIEIIENGRDKKELEKLMINYYVFLIDHGYSREFLYVSTKRFFSNNNHQINQTKQIIDYLQLFDLKRKKQKFLILMDINSLVYIDNISDNIDLFKNLRIVDVQKEKKMLLKDKKTKTLLHEYEALQNEDDRKKVSIVEYEIDDTDPYASIIKFKERAQFFDVFQRYFKHNHYSKQIYKILFLTEKGFYIDIKLPHLLAKRPNVSQDIIDERIKSILSGKGLTREAFISISSALDMHAEAFDNRNPATLLKNFWSALETLFSDPSFTGKREDVIHSVLHIVQKTYSLKLMRSVYSQLNESISLSDIGIDDFDSFVVFFSSNSLDSKAFEMFFNLLQFNPLLRTRLYSLKEQLSKKDKVLSLLENHRLRIEWQLKRIQRERNTATHLANELELKDVNVIINHLHNYFDYVVNFLMCKSENDDFIVSPCAVAFEAKNDNEIHEKFLRNNDELNAENYREFLFGPDPHLMDYQFEH